LPDDVYAEWTVARRDDLRRLYQGVLVHLAGLYTSRGNVHAALQALQRMLQLDPCHEAAARSAMRLYAASSRRAEAIRAYYCLADALRRELALRPEPETQALFRALQHQELPLQ
jgi:DNA-binding SARP family transcriptional activator